MHALILAAALMAAPNSSTDKAASAAASDACKPPQTTRTAMRGVQGPRKLADLPDGRLTRTVIRTVGDCDVIEVRTAPGEWRYEPAGRAQKGQLLPGPNPYVEPLR